MDEVRTASSSEDGFSLAEMMVALMVLGFVLSGLASVLITSVSATVTNERETRATAYAQQAIEQLQSVDWDFAGFYENEVDAAPSTWTEQLSASGFYDERQLVTIPSPVTAAARVRSVPAPTDTISNSGVDYVIHRFITWVDRTGDGTVDTRRFTVVADWDDRGAERGIVLTAERSPTQGDTEATSGGARILQMTVDPQTVGLTATQHLEADPADPSREIQIRVVLNQSAIGTPKLQYYGLDATDEWVLSDAEEDPLDTMDLEAMAQNGEYNTRFLFRLPETARMVEGTQDLLFVGNVGGETISRYATLTLVGGSLAGTNPTPPAPSGPATSPLPDLGPMPPPDGTEATPPAGGVGFTSVTKSNLCVDVGTWLPSSPFTISSSVRGLIPTDGDVMVSYQYRKARKNGNGHFATANEESVLAAGGTAASSQWTFTIPAGLTRHFRPGDSVTFTLRASRADGSSATAQQGAQVGTC